MVEVSGEESWSLYEAHLPAEMLDGTINSPFTLSLTANVYEGSNAYGGIYIDDLRIQPEDSELICYVYDTAQRLIAYFDDQHYPLLYEYNAEGILVRKLKETTDGVKTISETQYNVKGN